MKKEAFETLFSAIFLASWTARNYQKCVDEADFNLVLNPPVEHANLLARNAWKKMRLKDGSEPTFDSFFDAIFNGVFGEDRKK